MSIRDILIEESRRLDEIIEMAIEDLKKAPEGGIVTKNMKGKVWFLKNDHGKFTYLSKRRDMDSIRALTQKMYARKVLKVACRQKDILDRFISEYDPHSVSRIFIDGRHEGMFSPYVKEPLDVEPFSFRLTPALDIELVSQLKDICSRILEG